MNPIYSLYQGALRNPKTKWFVIIFTLLYIASPVDLIPDLIPVIGWLDDGVILSILVMELTRLRRKNKASKAEEIQFRSKPKPTNTNPFE